MNLYANNVNCQLRIALIQISPLTMNYEEVYIFAFNPWCFITFVCIGYCAGCDERKNWRIYACIILWVFFANMYSRHSTIILVSSLCHSILQISHWCKALTRKFEKVLVDFLAVHEKKDTNNFNIRYVLYEETTSRDKTNYMSLNVSISLYFCETEGNCSVICCNVC